MSDDDKTLLRHAVMGVLASRHPAALSVAGIRRRVEHEVDVPVADDDVSSALSLLEDLGLAKGDPDEFGSEIYWRATAAGLLSVERQAAKKKR